MGDMKLNRSLGISNHISECKSGNIIGLMEKVFPFHIIPDSREHGRHRVFTDSNTLLTMVLTSVQEDKTLANSVDLFYGIHQRHRTEAAVALQTQIRQQKKLDEDIVEKKAGRPKKYDIRMPKSLEKDISLNTAAYSKARERLSEQLTKDLFKASRISDVKNNYSHWHGYRVFIGDGTYLQMQDSKSIREQYEVKYNGEGHTGYPQGLLETVIERGCGQIHCFKLSNRHTSELSLFYELIDDIPEGSILLLDDLYNCFEIISKCKRKGIELLVPAKRERAHELVEILAEGDAIIRIKTPKNRSKWLENNEPPNKFLMRRICCKSPEGTNYELLSTILDKSITKEDFNMLYLTRWDIEIGIREIKTIMDINVLRSKTPDMALKELNVTLAAYNLIRAIIYSSIKNLPFSPKEDFIQKYYTFNKVVLMDKKGRIYNQWSTGRKRTSAINSEIATPKT